VRRLLEAGVNVYAADDQWQTPLHLSAVCGRVELSQMLVRAGADLHATNHEGLTPLDLAQREGHSAVVALLQQSAQEQEQELERQLRRQREKQAIDELDRTRLKPGEKWFLIDKVWLQSWFCFVVENGPVPSAITNHTLLTPFGAPRPGLEKCKHYRAVHESVWDYFEHIYGGGPAIPRIRVDIYAPSEGA